VRSGLGVLGLPGKAQFGGHEEDERQDCRTPGGDGGDGDEQGFAGFRGAGLALGPFALLAGAIRGDHGVGAGSIAAIAAASAKVVVVGAACGRAGVACAGIAIAAQGVAWRVVAGACGLVAGVDRAGEPVVAVDGGDHASCLRIAGLLAVAEDAVVGADADQEGLSVARIDVEVALR